MKKGLYLLLLLVTLAVGSVYQINLLMALAIGEILLWICLALVSWRCRRHLKLGFEKRVAVVLRQEKAPCTLRAENTGRTAILRFRARLRYGYPWEKKPKKLLVYGALEGREVQLSRVELPAVSCGLLHLTLDRVRVYDWLGLTSSSFSKQKAEAWLAVLPPFQEVPVDLSYRSAGDSAALLLSSLPQQNGDSEEVRQLREYREGDPTRSIHWKQSARTQTLWVKEYEQQSDRLVELHLGLNRFAFSTPSQREGFLCDFIGAGPRAAPGPAPDSGVLDRWGRPLPGDAAFLQRGVGAAAAVALPSGAGGRAFLETSRPAHGASRPDSAAGFYHRSSAFGGPEAAVLLFTQTVSAAAFLLYSATIGGVGLGKNRCV